jgi:hypothetical protein
LFAAVPGRKIGCHKVCTAVQKYVKQKDTPYSFD